MLLPREAETNLEVTKALIIEFLVSLNAGVVIEILLFGVHLVLFPICIHIILQKRATRQYVVLAAVTMMFVLSTVDVAITLRLVLKDLPGVLLGRITGDTMARRVYPKNPIFVTNNLIADLLLIYRCYMVWGKRLVIIGISVVLLIIDTIWGWIGAGLPVPIIKPQFTSTYLWSVFAMNILMTILTAGRIWWISRKTKDFIAKAHLHAYYIAIGILVESGLLYSIVILVALLASTVTFTAAMIFMLYRTVAIMPILMVVQAGLGRNFRPNDMETGIRSQFDETIVLDITRTTTGQVSTDNHDQPGDQVATLQPQTQEGVGVAATKYVSKERQI